jgi:hypothetical protein
VSNDVMTTTHRTDRPVPVAANALLWCAVIAGPLYLAVATAQIVLRDGFDIRRHAVSLLSNGDLGWIQIASFVVAGALVVAGSRGLARALRGGRGATWGPRLLGIYGVGLIASGVFVADPADGFPRGTPPGVPEQISASGALHFVAGGVAFAALIAACLVFARRFADAGERGWSRWSAVTGVWFAVCFMAVAAVPGVVAVNLLFTAAVVASWVWLTALAARARSDLRGTAGAA